MFIYNVYEYRGTGEYIHEKRETPIVLCKTEQLAQQFLEALYEEAEQIDGITPAWQDFTGRLIIFYKDAQRSFKIYGIERETVYEWSNEVKNFASMFADNL